MSKLQHLRQAVLAAATERPIEADQLFTFLRDGSVTDTGAGIRYEATAIVIVADWPGSAHPIARALALWLRDHEPAARDALSFEVDVIDHSLVDLSFELPFSETVVFDEAAHAACAAPLPDPDQFLPR